MSRDIYNARVAKLGMTLPGRDDQHTSTARGYVGWGPDEDATCAPGRSVAHADWSAALTAIQNPAREIHDFYFEVHTPSETCDCCAGSGKNRDYTELSNGFYNYGGGRWSGWGERKLYQNEIDALIDNRRLGGAKNGEVNPDNLHKYLRTFGHDAINRWILIPVRAANLGIDCNDCFECVGTGLTPTDSTKVLLHMWTVDPLAGTTRVDTATDVRVEDIEEIRAFMEEHGWEAVKRRFGWVTGDNMHPSIRYEENFRQDPNRAFQKKGWWDAPMLFPTFAQFRREFGIGGDPDLNLIFDYRIVADASYLEENPFSGSELPEEFSLQVMMTHPRKGADRVLHIDGCTPDDAEAIKHWLRNSFEVHGRHFAWSVGREFGNEAEVVQTPDDDRSLGQSFSLRP